MSNKNSIVAGIGVNDLNYKVSRFENLGGSIRQVLCPYYNRWKDILRRVNPQYSIKSRRSYEDSRICESWLYASNFKKWMESQEWKGLHLDKDIILKGNKKYSPETCAFVPGYINTCLLLSEAKRGILPIGVSKTENNRYRADVKGSGKSKDYLGTYATIEEAHKVWQWRKSCDIEEKINRYSNESCFRTDVAAALMKRVWDLRLDHANNVETKSL